MNKSKLYLEQLNKLKNKIHQSKIDEQVVPKEVEAELEKKRKKDPSLVYASADTDTLSKKEDKSKPKAASYQIGPADPLELAAAERMQAGTEHAQATSAEVQRKLGWPVTSRTKPIGETSKKYYETEDRLKQELKKAEQEGRVDLNDPRLKDYLKSVRVDPDYIGHMSDASLNMLLAGAFMSQGSGVKVPGSNLAKKAAEKVSERIPTRQDIGLPGTQLSRAIEKDVRSGMLPTEFDPQIGRQTTQVGINPPQPVDASKPNLPAKKGGRDVGYPSMPPEHVATSPKPEGPMTVPSQVTRALIDPNLAPISRKGFNWKVSTPEDKPKLTNK